MPTLGSDLAGVLLSLVHLSGLSDSDLTATAPARVACQRAGASLGFATSVALWPFQAYECPGITSTNASCAGWP